jgi:PAS domain S-box-containing protein
VSTKFYNKIEDLFQLSTGKEITLLELKRDAQHVDDLVIEATENENNIKLSERDTLIHLNSGAEVLVKPGLQTKLTEKDLHILNALIALASDIQERTDENENKKQIVFETIEKANPFYLAIDENSLIRQFGSKLHKTLPTLAVNSEFSQFFSCDSETSLLKEILTECALKKKLFFFKALDGLKRYKASVMIEREGFLLLTAPVVNSHYHLINYNLDVKDFHPHEYIAEYTFLKNATERSLEESRRLSDKIKSRNKEIESIARFPDENPNPIFRFSTDKKLMYWNNAAKIHFTNEDSALQSDFSEIINEVLLDGNTVVEKQITKGDRIFLLSAKSFIKESYINIYLFDITNYSNEIVKLNDSLANQRDFYEQILNGIPNDIAVFDENHKYLFVNPNGIKDPIVREFMIGKDDFDYCRMKGISDEMAHKRRAIFTKICETGSIFEWEDEHIGKDGTSTYVLRKMAPLFNEKNDVIMVIGYGLDITNRRIAEMRLIEANEENNRLRNFIDKTKDAIQVADEIGQLVYLNDEAKKRLGFDSINYRGHHVSEFEPFFAVKDSWSSHFNEMKKIRNLKIESKNINRETGKQTDVELNLNWEEINGEGFVIAISRDITEKKKVELELENKRKFQEILLKISNKYINVQGANMESTINESLSFVGNFVEVDRVYLFNYDHVKKTSSNTYEWCAEGIEPEIHNLQQIPYDHLPDWTNLHFNNKEMCIEDVDQLEAGSLREILEPQGIKSLLSIPIFSNDICIGFVGFDAVKNVKLFSDEERYLLRIFSELIVNMYERAEYLKQIEAARIEISNYNKYLEERVHTETEKNIELTKSITEQEKLVTIGEISAGIAHDLNTPLGSVKIGIESIDYSVKKIFENFIHKLEQHEVLDVYATSSARNLDLFQNTSKSRIEVGLFRQLLVEDFGLATEVSNQLSRYFVQCQIQTTETSVIKKFLNYTDTQTALDLLYALQNMKNLVDSTKLSTNKATDVIRNLRTFVRNSPDDMPKPVILHQTLQTVLTVFSHEIRKKIKLIYDVNTSTMIIGSEVKLFQLWSNIIKNAIEAMDEQTNGQLTIISSEENNKMHIHISNNGEMIPEHIQKVMFEKFFSTKLNKSGTGLGLSIVKSILEDHNATIVFESNKELTTFTLTFNTIVTDGKN